MLPAFLLAVFPFTTIAATSQDRKLDGHCVGTGLWGKSGICIAMTTCDSYGGIYANGDCPDDAANVKCCLVGLEGDPVSPCGDDSYCDWTSNGCSGTWKTGYCPGGSNYKCSLI